MKILSKSLYRWLFESTQNPSLGSILEHSIHLRIQVPPPSPDLRLPLYLELNLTIWCWGQKYILGWGKMKFIYGKYVINKFIGMWYERQLKVGVITCVIYPSWKNEIGEYLGLSLNLERIWFWGFLPRLMFTLWWLYNHWKYNTCTVVNKHGQN